MISCFIPISFALSFANSKNPVGKIWLLYVIASTSHPASFARYASNVLSAPPEKAKATLP